MKNLILKYRFKNYNMVYFIIINPLKPTGYVMHQLV